MEQVFPIAVVALAVVAIRGCTVLEGAIPRRALHLVREWARHHESALQLDWERARAGQRLLPIPPLE